MKNRLLLLSALAWLGLLLAVSFADSSRLVETRIKAEHGDAEAQYNLGILYHDGQGVPRDDAEAVKWYRKAAEQGNALAHGFARPPSRGMR
jgi:TPR repeat protein